MLLETYVVLLSDTTEFILGSKCQFICWSSAQGILISYMTSGHPDKLDRSSPHLNYLGERPVYVTVFFLGGIILVNNLC